jgi:hypothetical protein
LVSENGGLKIYPKAPANLDHVTDLVGLSLTLHLSSSLTVYAILLATFQDPISQHKRCQQRHRAPTLRMQAQPCSGLRAIAAGTISSNACATAVQSSAVDASAPMKAASPARPERLGARSACSAVRALRTRRCCRLPRPALKTRVRIPTTTSACPRNP